MVFDLEGGTLPATYPAVLWAALLRLVPQLANETQAGVLPLRAAESNEGVLLTKRTKLVLRLPKTLADPAAARLTGSTLQIGSTSLYIGKCKPRAIQPYPTIHALQVSGASDEVLFMDDIRKQLSEMGILAKLICGKRSTIQGEQEFTHAYSLVAHDLKPEDSLQLQYVGLGARRQHGFGIFIPYKVISGLSED